MMKQKHDKDITSDDSSNSCEDDNTSDVTAPADNSEWFFIGYNEAVAVNNAAMAVNNAGDGAASNASNSNSGRASSPTETLVTNMLDFCLTEPPTLNDALSVNEPARSNPELLGGIWNSQVFESCQDFADPNLEQPLEEVCKKAFNRSEELIGMASSDQLSELNFEVASEEVCIKRPQTSDHQARASSSASSAALSSESLKDVGKLIYTDGIQYIKRRASYDTDDGVLPYSGKFCTDENQFKLHGDGGLLTSKNNYIAIVRIEQVDELDNAINFLEAKMILLDHLKIVKVLHDQQLQDVKAAQHTFQTVLNEICNETTSNLQHAEDLFQLKNIMQKHHKDPGSKVLIQEITNNKFVSTQLKTSIAQHVEKEEKLNLRNKFFSALNKFFPRSESNRLFDILKKSVKEGIRMHKTQLLEKCPLTMKDKLAKLTDEQIFYVTVNDLRLFMDVASALNSFIFKTFTAVLECRYFDRIYKTKEDHLRGIVPITNRIYFFLCKSLLEISNEVKSMAGVERVLLYTKDEWKLQNLSNWTPKTTLETSLQHQLNMLLSMVNHFEPGKYVINTRFPYDFKLFKNIESSKEFQGTIEQMNKTSENDWRTSENSNLLPDELHVWICLLDDTIVHVFANDPENMEMFKCLLKFYMNFVSSGNFAVDSLESLRVITHNMLRYVANTGPFIRGQSSMDSEILQKQVNFMNCAIIENRMAFTEYRDLIEVFTAYWKQRDVVISNVANKLPGAHFKSEVEEIQNLLLECMSVALEKKVKSSELTRFCRVYDEFLTDFNDLQLNWFVRLPPNEQSEVFTLSKVLKVVNNKWKDSNNKCYEVVDLNKFVKLYQVLLEDEELPKHYLVDTLKTFLKFIIDLGNKTTWASEDSLTEDSQINAMDLLISSIRSSLLYLKEQTDYICFDRFYEESTKPFSTAINESKSLADFSKRVLLIKESFWYIRNLNTIDVETALELCSRYNTFNEEHLKSGFNHYSEQFEKYMGDYADKSNDDKIQEIVNDVKRKIKLRRTPKWNFDHKHNHIPIILAGLAAVWSIQASQDVASSGKYLKPHCIQILCILRLLGSDNENTGVEKHLAQVLTGQGKSLILGLTAAMLALFGHKVQILCYSSYLAERDAADFEELFEYFSVDSMVTYDTFGELAQEHLRQNAAEAQNYIFQCIGLPKVHNDYDKKQTEIDMKKTVLLIDEVDVFFTEDFYGNTYNQGVFPVIPGLDLIQEKIWDLVTQGHWDPGFIRRKVKEYENYCDHPDIQDLKAFINKTDMYEMLEANSAEIAFKYYSNKRLYLAHLDRMITTAMDVNQRAYDDSLISRFRITKKGMIAYRNNFGKYSVNIHMGYYNIFTYFKLKITGFVQQISNIENYGYLDLEIGSISYAKMPESYPLILGVTGTLTTLNKHEKDAVENHYQIHKSSVMPSFFGSSNLRFNSKTNFACMETKSDWSAKIFARVNEILAENRSVLVFFDTEVKLMAFRLEYFLQLDRLNTLTANTEEDMVDHFINEAGVAKTITLATRDMGRGVDYKSSISVEKNGGVHVIQTFFSLDIKEETQIKGRTARKDNRGSYELIVCLEDLYELEFVESEEDYYKIDYRYLQKARERLTDKAGEKKALAVKNADMKHDKTINFYKTIKMN